MVMCFVPGCKSGNYNSSKETTHLMTISKHANSDTMTEWTRNVPKQKGKTFDFKKSRLCYKHFEDRYLIKTTQIKLGSAIIHEEPRARWKLTDDAIPTIFSNDKVPKYFDRKVYARPPPRNRDKLKTSTSDTKPASPVLFKLLDDRKQQVDIAQKAEIDLFTILKNAVTTIQLPPLWLKRVKDDCLEFYKLTMEDKPCVPTFHSERTVKIYSSMIPKITIRATAVTIYDNDDVSSVKDLLRLLEKVDQLVICGGIKFFNMFQSIPGGYRCGNSWISDACQPLVPSSPCKSCADMQAILRQMTKKLLHQNNMDQSCKVTTVKYYQQKSQQCLRRIRRIKNRLNSTRESLKILQRKFLNLETGASLEQAVKEEDNLPVQMKTALLAAATVAKSKSKHGVRYQSDWILQSLLLKICSPKAYRHLRDNQVLPLPHPMHLTGMLRGLPCQFGFNEFVFSCLREEFDKYPKRDRQVMLIFDEMKIREAVTYDKGQMRFTGYIDYGEFTNEKKTKTKRLEADHALVFMCRSINSKLTQPIASFATRGAAPGNMLAKIIISCIMKLESSNCEVVGVISDGATTNKSAWKALGITGVAGQVKNKITNPYDEKRVVHFFCDIPHVVKCVRNNFHKMGFAKYCGQQINWGFYHALYDLDRKSDVRVAFNLTSQHINPNPFQKMVVSYATQIFSKTVADRLQYYREVEQSQLLKNSDATEQFTRTMNDLFDACNARVPKEGLRKNCQKYKVHLVIQDFLKNLKIQDTFASGLTMASIRVTLTSTLELIDYLCDSIGYDYVLTVKFNQDCLENFFGLLRSFGGDDCHPTATSFSHLFRLLSIYMPTLKTLKGNTSTDGEYSVLSYLDSLKALKKSANLKSSKVMQDLDEILISRIIKDVSNTNVSNNQPNSLRSIVYYLCGFLVNKATSFTKCSGCLKSLEAVDAINRDSFLIQIKDLGSLKYPNQYLFRLICDNVEPKITEFLSNDQSRLSACVMKEIVTKLDDFSCNGIGCSPEHCDALVINLIKFYITIRMYFFAKNQNREDLKSNTETKKKMKLAKLS